jgi:hydrogenase nickel insertion protein HypA
MHEFSIAQQIAEVVLRTARENQARLVERVLVVIGELALLSEEQVRFWVEEIFSHRAMTRDAQLEIVIKPALAHCQKCGFQGSPPQPGPEAHFLFPTLACPRCGQPGMAIKEGRECLIQTITFQK